MFKVFVVVAVVGVVVLLLLLLLLLLAKCVKQQLFSLNQKTNPKSGVRTFDYIALSMASMEESF